MQNRYILFMMVALAMFFVSGCASTQSDMIKKSSDATVAIQDNSMAAVQQTEAVNSNLIAPETLARHSLVDDCWVVYSGEVYDVTQFLAKSKDRTNSAVKYCGSTDDYERALRTSASEEVKLFEALSVKVGTLS